MPPELRPTEVLQEFWDETILIEEDAEFLDAVYVEAA